MTNFDRHQGRTLAMQALCQLEVQGEPSMPHVRAFLEESEAASDARAYAAETIQYAWNNRAPIDARLTSALENWQLDRLSPVDRNVIRVAVVELMRGRVPPRVILNEAIEIGREYGGQDSPTFINGVLDRVWRQMRDERGEL